METDDSLNQSMDRAKKHYSSLFFLPSYQKSLISIALTCIICVSLCALVISPDLTSAAVGVTLFAITLLTDLVVSKLILKDPIFVTRRTSVMSFYCWLLWLGFIALGTALSLFFGPLLWVKLTLLGFAAVLTLRNIVLSATSSSAKWRQILSALLQPLLCVAVFLVFWASKSTSILYSVLAFIILSPIIAYIAVYILLRSLNNLGKKTYGLPAMPLFRAFVLNWVTNANAPLEKHLEEMGEDANIDISLLKFESSKPKAAIIVPLVHPGPFKNIGSSLLPSLLKQDYQKECNCDACIPLGILGHELDLASQAQNHRIISEVLSKAKFKADMEFCSPFTRETEGPATASCQIFGDTALLCFTLAPKTTEDIPQELGRVVLEEAKKNGLKHAVIINAHNCLDKIVDTAEHLDELEKAASKCLKKAINLPKKPFKVGAATVYPDEFTLKQGMGTGGITAIVVEIDNKKNAYIVIDGNNMIPNLREKIIISLSSLGIDESEVLTTDTHAVSALVLGNQGYHPVGEVMDHDILIKHINDATKKATANLEMSKAGSVQFIVPNVRVIGEERLNSMTALVDTAITKAKKIVVPIFGVEGLLLILLLLLL